MEIESWEVALFEMGNVEHMDRIESWLLISCFGCK